jgi:hypothetical protein
MKEAGTAADAYQPPLPQHPYIFHKTKGRRTGRNLLRPFLFL